LATCSVDAPRLFSDMQTMMRFGQRTWANKITGPNAGGPRQLPMRARCTACVAQFCLDASRTRT
jgi:hypothetical protein